MQAQPHMQNTTISNIIDDGSVICVATVNKLCDNANLSNDMHVTLDANNVSDNDASMSDTLPDIRTDVEMLHDESADNNMHNDIENTTLHVDGNIDAFRLRSTDISGRCIIDFAHVFAELQRLSNHWIGECRFTDLVTQTIRNGLKTQFFIECRMCHYKNSFWSEPTSDEILDVNRGAVSGTILTGTGHKQLEQLLAAVDVPCMSNKTYIKYHNAMSEAFAAAAEEEMRVAGEEEKRLAIQRGDVIDGIPHIPVITDGSWMKRSYRTGSYDSPSGAAIITGYYSKKVLFVGVRNRYCTVCAQASKNNVEAKDHTCYKNWGNNQSSTSMESDIILEGFRRSIDMHGLIYSKFIGDGDSNVSKKLRDFAPYNFGVVVEKIECTNHLLRNLCNKIREIGSSGGRNLSKLKKVITNSVMKIRNIVVKAASHRRNSDASRQEKIALLIKDLQNIPSHIFGEHRFCSALQYFCNGEAKEGEENLVPQLISAGFYVKIENAMKRIIDNADSILYQFTSNSVETCNGIISKFIGGKRIHFARRGSYETRVKAAVVQFNSKKTLSKTCHAIGTVAPSHTQVIEKRKIVINNKYHEKVRVAKETGASVRTCKQYAKTSAVDKDYGPNAERPDVEGDMYEQLKHNHFEMLLNQQKNRTVLEYATRGQHANPQWHHIRQKLLTASNFGKVCSRRETTSCKNLVKSILYPPKLRNAPVEWGREHETIAREQLQVELGMQIDECGLFIDSRFSYLAATPDGIIGDDTIVEIKCPYAARQMSPTDAMLNKISDLHRIFDKTDDSRMNKKHAYFFQVQGQLHITQRQYCVFAVWTPLGLKYTFVERDDKFWEECMSTQLQRFYENCMVPEIIDSRAARNMPIREPQYVIEAQAATQKKNERLLLNDK